MAKTTFAVSTLDQDAPHGLGRGGEEMAAAVPIVARVLADQADEGLVNEGGRLKCLLGFLLGQSYRGELAKLVINERQESPPRCADPRPRWRKGCESRRA